MFIFRVRFFLYSVGNSIGKPFSNKTGHDGFVTRFCALVDRFKRNRSKMKPEVEAFNAEKQIMKEIEVNNDDIIQLNVGGQKFTTTRFTLRQVNGSLLDTMFSRNRKRGLKRDQDGAVVLDFNPEHFGWILNYLRAKKISTPENPAVFPKVPKDEMKNFNILLEYLYLTDEVVLTRSFEVVKSERFYMRSSQVTLQEDRKVAVHDSSQIHTYVLGENVYQRGTIRFKLKLDSFQNNLWIMVGIVKADVVPNGPDSYFWPGAYGWSLGDDAQLYKGGVLKGSRLSWKKMSKQGDMVELGLDCDGGRLSLHLPTGQLFNMVIPKSQSWRLHVNLYGANDKIRIVEVVQD